jgi:formate hydrogenlyase subunit 6/NADH:ubiquinone oxidoreductase subunit I
MKAIPIFRTILRYLANGPATRRYPSVPAYHTPATRGHLVFNIDTCIYCGLCRMHCPAQAIEVSKPDLTWQLNRFRCVICGACIDYCPKDCLSLEPTYIPPSTEAVIERHQGTPAVATAETGSEKV